MCSLKSFANYLKKIWFKQNLAQRELWSKAFHVLSIGCAVSVGMKMLSDNNPDNNTNVFIWGVIAIIFHMLALIALISNDDE